MDLKKNLGEKHHISLAIYETITLFSQLPYIIENTISLAFI